MQSYGVISIQEVQDKIFLLSNKKIASDQFKIASFPNITVIFFESLKIYKDIEYLVSLDIQFPNSYNYYSKNVVWLGNLKHNSMEFNISAENQHTKKYVNHLWII